MTAHHQTLIASEYPYQRSDVLPIMINRALGAPRGQSQRGWEPRSSKSRHVKSLQVTLRHITSSPSQVTSSPSPVQSSPSQDLTFRILAVHRWQGAVVSASATAPPSTTSRGSAKLGFERCNPVEQRLLLRRVLTRHVGLYRRHLSAQVKSSQVESSRVESSQVESSRVKSSQVKSSQVESSRVESSQVESSRVESSQVESSQVKSSQVKSSRAKSNHVNSCQVESSQVKSNQAQSSPVRSPSRSDSAAGEHALHGDRHDAGTSSVPVIGPMSAQGQ